MKAVILLSGGLDSAVCLAWAAHKGFEPVALTIDYGQRHRVEVAQAKRLAESFEVRDHRVLHLDLEAIGGSSLTAALPVPKHESVEELPAGIPSTYVPARNTIFLGLALGLAEVVGARDLVIGVNAVDYSGYPDCRPAFIAAFEALAKLGTKAGTEGRALQIHAPLTNLSKADIVRMGVELGVDFSATHSCYDPSTTGEACGRCDACLLRAKGFAEAAVPDPTRYARR